MQTSSHSLTKVLEFLNVKVSAGIQLPPTDDVYPVHTLDSKEVLCEAIQNVHQDRYQVDTKVFFLEMAKFQATAESEVPIVRLSRNKPNCVVLPQIDVMKHLLLSVPRGASREWLELFRFVTCSSMSEWVFRFSGAPRNKQQWITQEISSGFSASDAVMAHDYIREHFDRVFNGVVPLIFEPIINARASQLKCLHHVQMFGYHKLFDEIKMTSAIKGYNPMRANFLYFLPGIGWNFSSSHYRIEKFVPPQSLRNTGEVLIKSFEIPNDRYITLAHTLLPYQVIKLASEPNDDDDFLGYSIDEKTLVSTGNLEFDSTIPAWWMIQHFLNSPYDSPTFSRHVSAQVEALERAGFCTYHSVCVSHEMRLVFYDVIEDCSPESWYHLCLGIQWFADLANAVNGKYYPNPVISRLVATSEFEIAELGYEQYLIDAEYIRDLRVPYVQ
jgi:hypothetical protein